MLLNSVNAFIYPKQEPKAASTILLTSIFISFEVGRLRLTSSRSPSKLPWQSEVLSWGLSDPHQLWSDGCHQGALVWHEKEQFKKAWEELSDAPSPAWTEPGSSFFSRANSQSTALAHPNGWNGEPGMLQQEVSGFSWCCFSQDFPTIGAAQYYQADIAVWIDFPKAAKGHSEAGLTGPFDLSHPVFKF